MLPRGAVTSDEGDETALRTAGRETAVAELGLVLWCSRLGPLFDLRIAIL